MTAETEKRKNRETRPVPPIFEFNGEMKNRLYFQRVLLNLFLREELAREGTNLTEYELKKVWNEPENERDPLSPSMAMAFEECYTRWLFEKQINNVVIPDQINLNEMRVGMFELLLKDVRDTYKKLSKEYTRTHPTAEDWDDGTHKKDD